MSKHEEAPTVEASSSPTGYNPIKAATQIVIHHRRLMDAMTQQGQNEIAAALDNLECAIHKARTDLGL